MRHPTKHYPICIQNCSAFNCLFNISLICQRASFAIINHYKCFGFSNLSLVNLASAWATVSWVLTSASPDGSRPHMVVNITGHQNMNVWIRRNMCLPNTRSNLDRSWNPVCSCRNRIHTFGTAGRSSKSSNSRSSFVESHSSQLNMPRCYIEPCRILFLCWWCNISRVWHCPLGWNGWYTWKVSYATRRLHWSMILWTWLPKCDDECYEECFNPVTKPIISTEIPQPQKLLLHWNNNSPE